ncbi:N-6 DNA methylase [Anoxybacter fermentans]|uniref:N-6 DNA methylase n=1 Tax=Anoxybacter fermentans TaxID=1323375 RepID=A0A3Q9HPA0_9FIRM|nr:class I SAM-dependent RNA methyltransferase [Anoxybacter fermentans]AZR72609.1 N-6 DNA methylase [Anoxybacter fermentans]
MSQIELIATAAFGLEAIVAREVKDLGYSDVQVENGRVVFYGDELAICRSNLWLRCADRVLIKMGEFEATDFDQLFDKTRALPWHEWLPKNAKFPVKGKSVKSKLHSVPACQSVVKKAIVEEMSKHYGIQHFEENGPLFTIEVTLYKDVATLTIDTSGAGLHKRGYRNLSAKAPLKETLAAAMIYISRWMPDYPLVDPMCGSGTIPIEAAMMAANIAPGLKRDFAAEKWPLISSGLWKKAREEAKDLIKWDDNFYRILGYDIDGEVLKLARYHAARAGVEEYTDFHRRPVAELKSSKKYGYIICNPPYGERLSNRHKVKKLYQEMGRVFAELGDGTWSFYILTSFRDFEKYFGTYANKKRKLYNGRIQVDYYQYYGLHPLFR